MDIHCFVHSRFEEAEKVKVRERVCRDLPPEFFEDGHHFCVLHAPVTSKRQKFWVVLEDRLENLQFDLRAVYFPDCFVRRGRGFQADFDLSYAFFEEGADFSVGYFMGEADLSHIESCGNFDISESTYLKQAFFTGAQFQLDAIFHHSEFERTVDLSGIYVGRNATFYQSRMRGYADLHDAVFSGDAEFDYTWFLSRADLTGVEFKKAAGFLETSFAHAHFRQAKFHAAADFRSSYFKNEVDFRNAAFAEGATFDYAKFALSQPEILDGFSDLSKITFTDADFDL